MEMEDKDVVVASFEDFADMQSMAPTKHRRSYFYRIDEYTIDGEYLRTWESYTEISNAYGISRFTVRKCVIGVTLMVEKIGKIFLKEGASIDERLMAIDAAQMSPREGKAVRVPIKEYDMKGNLIMVYPSIAFAGSHSRHCVEIVKKVSKGERLCTSDGKIFLRDNDDINTRLELIRQRDYNESMNKSIDMYSRKGTPNGHFRNAAEAAERFNVSVMSILDCCFGNIVQCKANIFLFSGDSIKERLKLIKQKKK